MHWKMAESWVNFVHNFNESSRYSTKVFTDLNFQFEQYFISFHLIYDRNVLLYTNIAVTYLTVISITNILLTVISFTHLLSPCPQTFNFQTYFLQSFFPLSFCLQTFFLRYLVYWHLICKHNVCGKIRFLPFGRNPDGFNVEAPSLFKR